MVTRLNKLIRGNDRLFGIILNTLDKRLVEIDLRVDENKGKIPEADWSILAEDPRFMTNLYDFTHDYETTEDFYKTAKDCKMMADLFKSLPSRTKFSSKSFPVSWPCRIAIGKYTERATNKLLRLQKC